ncbi:T9SS type B sorting domain-containing protein [Marinilabiliaceae bacterium ANBcel2]|nr:T9SS type B sorting domain-containing protein [Marinilabiliaceae bacterium ANBcel2]
MKILTRFHLLASIITINLAIHCNAQIDKTFWFVAPETTISHDQDPGVIRVTAFENAATVTISMPANPNFETRTLNVEPHSQERLEFWGDDLWMIENGTMNQSSTGEPNDWENWTAGTPFNKGLLIESDEEISVYYEVANMWNPERFNLKGSNALGEEFYIPSQNIYRNVRLSVRAKEQVDIVATENNTEVTITVTDDVEGHDAGDTFTITLDRGETYCLRSKSREIPNHLGGTHIKSNKPIAVTISDDSIQRPGYGAYDLVGDQLVPLNIIGNEYIAINTTYQTGLGNVTDQLIFVMAVEDNTTILVDGDEEANLDKGEMQMINISNNAIYIEATDPIYAYQFAGVGGELGSALLPAIECTGSREVSFARIYDFDFTIQLMTQQKYINDFVMLDDEGNIQNHLDDLEWHPVTHSGDPGSDDTWYTAVKNFPSAAEGGLSTSPYTIKFDDAKQTDGHGLFHLSVMDVYGGSLSYGYFSSYNTIRIEGPSIACQGDQIILSTNQEGIVPLWFHEDDPYEPFSSENSVVIDKPGLYWVETDYAGCIATDYIEVEFNMPEFSLGDNIEICPGDDPVELEVEGFNQNEQFEWIVNGNPVEDNNSNYLAIYPDPGSTTNVSLTVTDDLGCSFTDEVEVTIYEEPYVEWSLDNDEVCLGENIGITTSMDLSYQWFIDDEEIEGAESSWIEASESGPGEYRVVATSENECIEEFSREITVNPLPEPQLEDITLCQGESAIFEPNATDGQTYVSYEWFNSSTNATVEVTEPNENVQVTVTNEYGCSGEAEAIFDWYTRNVFTFGADTSVCVSGLIEIEIDETFNDYNWEFISEGATESETLDENTNPSASNHILSIEEAEENHSGTYSITATDSHDCPVEGQFNLDVLPPPTISLIDDFKDYESFCEGDSIRIESGEFNDREFIDHEWSVKYDEDDEYEYIYNDDGELHKENWLVITDGGYYQLLATQANGCYAIGDVEIGTVPQPFYELSGATVCPDEEVELSIENWDATGGEDNDYVDDPNEKNFEWWYVDDHLKEEESLTVSEEGTYRLTVYNSNGCFLTEETTVEWHTLPDININNEEICDDENFTLSLPNELTEEVDSYTWSQIDGPTWFEDQDWDIDISDAGEYEFTLSITDNNGCHNSENMLLTILYSPVFELPTGEFCDGETIEIEVDPSFEIYQWNGSTAEGQDNTYILNEGDEDITLTVINDQECSNTLQENITVHPLPTVNLGGDIEVCAGEEVVLSIIDDNYSNIYWSNRESDVTSIKAQRGVNHVTVIDQYGCSGYDETEVIWHPSPDISLGENIHICPVNLPVNLEVPGDFQDWEWHIGEEIYNTREVEAAILDTVNVLRVMNEHNCWNRTSKTISLEAPYQFNPGIDIEECEPAEVMLDAGSHTLFEMPEQDEDLYAEILSYNWYNTNSNHSLSTQQELRATESGEYVVEIFDGCWHLTDTFDVKYYPTPVITHLDTTLYAQATIFVNDGTEPYRYAINEESWQSSNTFSNLNEGEHTVWVEDSHGCETFTVFELNLEYDIEVPNFFTPNNNGFNDTWKIDGLESMPESEISIYDRYGKLLIKYNASEGPWDGTYQNRPLPSDDYWYVIHLKPLNKLIKGNVTILR